MPSRRRRALLALAALVTASVGVVAAPAAACACGGLVAPDGYSSAVPREQAVLSWEAGRETVLLELRTLSEAPTMGLIVPTPTPADATLADAAIFGELERFIAPRPVVTGYRWWPDWGPGTDSAGAPEAVGSPGTEVLDRLRLGPLDVTILAASDADALGEWLTENGFTLPAAFASALEPYVAENWSYVAARIAPEEEADFDGTLDPIRLTFDSEEFVYPMRLSAAAQTTQDVWTYVLDEHRVERTDATADLIRPDLVFAGRIDPADARTPELSGLVGRGAYLTVQESLFLDPGSEVVSDFAFARAGDDEEFVRTYGVVVDKRIGPFFAGPVLVVSGLVLVGAVAVGVVLGMRRRRRADRTA